MWRCHLHLPSPMVFFIAIVINAVQIVIHHQDHNTYLSLALFGNRLLFQLPKVGQESQQRGNPRLRMTDDYNNQLETTMITRCVASSFLDKSR